MYIFFAFLLSFLRNRKPAAEVWEEKKYLSNSELDN
jgi:hypothetical protein